MEILPHLRHLRHDLHSAVLLLLPRNEEQDT
jgi:hypothetical protein